MSIMNSIAEKYRKNNKLFVFFILVIITLCFILIIQKYFGDYINWKSYDFYVQHVGGKSIKPHNDVILLLIDESSLQYAEGLGIGRWPWSRNIYPEILSYINMTNPPKAIFFDILFAESDRGEGNDEYFASEIANSGNIFHNVLFLNNEERDKPIPLPVDIKKNYLLSIDNPEKIKFERINPKEFLVPIPCLRSDITCNKVDHNLADALPIAKGLEVASFNPDSDGVYRRGRILFNYEKYFMPSMALSAIMAYTSEVKISILPNNTVKVGEYKIPLDENGKYLVNYHVKDRIPAYSMSAVMLSAYYLAKGEEEKIIIKPDEFKDKIVIIGCSAMAAHDQKNTPIHKTTPGPEIHANIISNILQQNEIIVEKQVHTYIIMMIVILLCIASVLFISSNILKLSILVILSSSYVVINIWLFHNYNYQSPLYLILGTGLISTAFPFLYLTMTEGAEKRKYSKILGNMIDPSIVKEALNDLDGLKKGGEKIITAFFSDIASFSTISEKLNSIDLAALLNEYLSAMTVILKNYGGTLDKYIGDAVVGIFGAPLDNPDNAILAAKASLEMSDKLILLREKWTRDNKYCPEAQQMQFRIGLNTGKAKVGFMGTENLASYTMMGDTVNLAARLEAAGKDYGVSILVSEMTNKLIEGEMFLRKLDAVRVKGKSEPVYIYELIGIIGQIPDNIIEAAKFYEDAFDMYKERRWDEAVQLFKKSLKVKGKHDKSVNILANRCLLYKKEPPPENWDGVFTRIHK